MVQVPTARVDFDGIVSTVQDRVIVRLPERASRQLPSRGQVAIGGTVNGHEFSTVVEPDGSSGHWIRIDDDLQRLARLKPGDLVSVSIEPADTWPEPDVPDDLQAALGIAPEEIRQMWAEITPMSRWEWVRWVNATLNPDTRKRRVEVTISKMQHGKRRPCCFNRAACTDPYVSKSGVLVVPDS